MLWSSLVTCDFQKDFQRAEQMEWAGQQCEAGMSCDVQDEAAKRASEPTVSLFPLLDWLGTRQKV